MKYSTIYFVHCFPLAVIRYGLVVRIPGSHPGGPGSIPGNGKFFKFSKMARKMSADEDGIRTHAGRAHWISSPTP